MTNMMTMTSMDHEHAHGEFDIHIWLDPFNAKVIADNIAEELSKLDPANTSTYQNNRDKFVEKVSDTEEKLANNLITMSAM